jgi:hypothetical protein
MLERGINSGLGFDYLALTGSSPAGEEQLPQAEIIYKDYPLKPITRLALF